VKPLKPTKGVKPPGVAKRANFLGRGVNSPESGTTPKESQGMGFYYGTGQKNAMGRLRDQRALFRSLSRYKAKFFVNYVYLLIR
jgi:hypothetical protein